MLTHKLIPALVLSATAFLSDPSFAASQALAAPCILRQHQVSNVRPYLQTVYDGRVSHQKMRGAELFVVAEPGLTAEWLQLTLSRHIAEMRATPGMPDCPLSVEDVSVQVQPGGNGFWVRLVAPNQAKGEEVLRRARLLGV